MLKKLYAEWMYRWETRLTTRDENRIVRPLEWGFDWIAPFLREHALGMDELDCGIRGDDAAAEAAMARINQILIQHSDTFFGYRRPSDFRLEVRAPQLFPTNVRPETLAQDADLKRKAETGELAPAQFLRFTSPERTRYPENDFVNARWFPEPPHKDARRPRQAIVVLPQWNADAFSHNALCHMFNRMGIAALRLSKPYHDIRRPAELERSDYAVSANIGRTLSACRQAVVDIRCCIDWLQEQGYEQFGVLGTSLGSCYAFLASAHDPRIRVNAFNHASTSFGDVVWAGQSTRHIRKGLEQAGFSQERLRAIWGAISPVYYYEKFASLSAGGPDKNSLLVYAEYDLTFPREYSLEVVRAFREHGVNFEKRVLPCGHYTTGETPFKYIDGWYLGWFVYRAYKQMREQAALQSSSEPNEDSDELVSS